MSSTPSAILAGLTALSRAELEALQLAKLQRQLARVYARNGFYRDRFDAAKVRPEQIRSVAEFRDRIPTMAKADCLADQQEHPPFGRRVGVPREDVVLMNLTGGTSGQGQEVFGRTNHDIAMQGHFHYLPWYLAGLRRGDSALNCVPAGGLTTGGWGPTEGFRVAGVTSYAVGGTMSTDAKIDLMRRFRDFHFIYASTSYLHTLTEAFRRKGLSPAEEFPMLRTLYIAAESYPVEWAQRVEAFWGAKLHEGYGSTQAAGFSAGTCEHGAIQGDRRGVMHFFEWHNLVEVVNPETMELVGPGEEGEIVLTNLDIIGSPVIRFRTGDKGRYVSPGAGPSGRPWIGVEAGTIGRIDDMMKIRGNNMWPSAVDGVVFRCDKVWEYAGRVYTSMQGKTCVELRLAFKADAAFSGDSERQALLKTIGAELKQTTNINMDLVVVDREDLPSYEYKSRRWKDERAEGFRSGAVNQ
ncbi:phenylacetate-CoA ligase [Rhodoligotrophos appendicifer]|uniref:phenylacetate--CoA ligase family protein n=1 Tax=Rhodoligotrophos appendicifer TaxID=987056 RepID=UPI0014780673|nr:AMP-binding protein [Rhodoligotrophos appendicifer]